MITKMKILFIIWLILIQFFSYGQMSSARKLLLSQESSWDIEKIIEFDSWDISEIDNTPQDIAFNPDGTKMYILGSTNDAVYEYSLSTPWNPGTKVNTYTYTISPSEAVPQGLFFKPDGTKMYVVGSSSDAVKEYNLGTAWVLSTVSYVQTFSISFQTLFPTGIFFKPDGTKMYISGSDTDPSGHYVYEYNLSTAWNISSTSYLQRFDVASLIENISDVFFKPDGTKAYIPGYFLNDKIVEVNLVTAWNVSTISFAGNKDLTNIGTSGIYIRNDGDMLFLVMYVGGGTGLIYKYTFG